MKQHLFFNDAWSYRVTRIKSVDTRLKLLFALGCILILFWSGPVGSVIILSGILLGVRFSGYPWRFFLARLIFPLMIAVFYLFTKAFLVGQTVAVDWPLGSWQLVLYREGLYQGLTAALRIITGVSAVILLSITTSVAEFIRAARWFKVPVALLELLMLVYHYIFILWQEAVRLYNAQQLRLGHETWRRSFFNMIKLTALVLVRALERAETASQAMQLRGYEENLPLEMFERRRA